MRNRRRNDSYVSQRIDTIIDSIPNNPFTGFSGSIHPFEQYTPDRKAGAESSGKLRQPPAQ